MRLAAIVATGAPTAHFGDAPAYQLAARSLATTGRYPLRTDPLFFRPPGYPVFLAAVTLGHPERVVAAKVANAATMSLAVLVLAAIAARLFRHRGAGLAAGILAALDPSLAQVSIDLQSEPLFLLLLCASGFLLLAAVDRPSSGLGAAAGVCLGLAALTRPSAIAVAPLLAAPLADARYPVRIRAHLAASGILGFVLSVAPWTVRNAIVFHEFIPISDVGGFNFEVGNSDAMARFFEIRTRPAYDEWSDETYALVARRIDGLRSRGIASPGAVSNELVRERLAAMAARPRAALRLLLRKCLDWLRPYPNPMFWPRSVVLVVGGLYVVLTALAVLGLIMAPRRGVMVFALAFLALSMAAHVLTVVGWRYRVPYWDPVLILYAAPTLAALRRSAGNGAADGAR